MGGANLHAFALPALCFHGQGGVMGREQPEGSEELVRYKSNTHQRASPKTLSIRPLPPCVLPSYRVLLSLLPPHRPTPNPGSAATTTDKSLRDWKVKSGSAECR